MGPDLTKISLLRLLITELGHTDLFSDFVLPQSGIEMSVSHFPRNTPPVLLQQQQCGVVCCGWLVGSATEELAGWKLILIFGKITSWVGHFEERHTI